jgi:hypothetical protein
VRRREGHPAVVGQQRLLGPEIGHPRGQDRPLGSGVAERLEVFPAQRPLPENLLSLTLEARRPSRDEPSAVCGSARASRCTSSQVATCDTIAQADRIVLTAPCALDWSISADRSGA